MQFTYYGHSSFAVEIAGKTLLFDPFITPNPLTEGKVDAAALRCDYLLLSHAHGDHVQDTELIISNNPDAVLISSYEIVSYYEAKGIKGHPMNLGGKFSFGDLTIRMVAAQHSSVFPDGAYGGPAAGFVVSSPEGSFYYAGDTALTLDMQLIPRYAELRFAVLPVGGNFTMNWEDAITASDFIQCPNIIGVHHQTFGYIVIDQEAAKAGFVALGKQLHLPTIGESISL